MAYRIEGKDIVIAGFEDGVSDSPYSGAPDMRNVELLTVPGEASVQLALAAATKPAVFNAVAYTAQNTGDTITVASTTGLYVGTAIVLAANTATGLSNGIVYYVFNIVGNTFQVRLAPASGSAVAVTGDGSGTLTTYQYGNQRGTLAQAPVSYWVDRTGAFSGANGVLLMDGSNYLWLIQTTATSLPADTLIFLGNIGGLGASSLIQSGVAIFNGYIILLGETTVGEDYARVSTLLSSGPAIAWHYAWKNMGTNAVNARVGVIISKEDGNMYWTSADGVGSLIEQPNETFDPTDSTTYSITDAAIPLPETDESTCLAELGTNLLIGGRNSFVYIWDKISLGFTGLLNIPDVFITFIVAASQNAYVFAGNRGRIYITNGSGIDLYKKVPDYLTGAISPYITWQDANFSRNQLLFGFTATSNAAATLTTTSGAWAIDLDNDTLRMINKTSNSGYAGTSRMVIERPTGNSSSPTLGLVGTALSIGWFSSGTYNVDIPSTTPYTNYESYIDTEMVPVGTYLDPFTPSQIEWKTSAPIVSGEGVAIYYRTNISDAFVAIGESTTAGALSDVYQTNFQKAQWVQFRLYVKSTASSPSYTRLTEMRIRDWPSGKDAQK